MRKHAILFLAANPVGLAPLRLDEEAREIEEEIRRASRRDAFQVVARVAARPLDLLRALRDVRPSIVHFAGHTHVDGIYLMGPTGEPAPVTRDALHETFGAAGKSVQIVVLNGCATEHLARTLCDVLPVCVGTSAAIDEAAARAFSIGFYGALASSESAMLAFKQGKAAMHLEATGDHDRPRLHHRHDVDPAMLVLAEDAKVTTDIAVGLPCPSEIAAVIERYRARKRRAFERWDLRAAGPQPTTGNRPTEITLDEMYIPLRFDPRFDPTVVDRGVSIHPDDLLQPQRPHVIVGPAGSGKTTWMRWTFRRLIQEPRAVPFLLELRAIAAAWKTPQDAARSIESYLAAMLDECGTSDAAAIVHALLADISGPCPVILIDGWDELGAQGERVRERLIELCNVHPHAVVVVSSRPYGESRPSSAEAFDTVHIQPLSDDDVRLLATRFHCRVHGSDEPAGSHATDELMAALAAAPDARALVGTMLLLTMMLLLSREGPLPDRRHKLYTACLRNMLLHRVTQRERDGVAIDADQQWRPDDSEERLRVIAELAYRMQAEGYEMKRRAPMVRAWHDAARLLGDAWTQDQRERFLRWLVETSGVLVDRTDGSVQFAHLSFQEYLAAYYLFISREGDERMAAVRCHMPDRNWWETLRLWAALIGDQWPDKLAPVLELLRADPEAYWLAGQMFADGMGRPSDFEAWAAALPARISDPFAEWDDCASAWGSCKQERRRERVARALTSATASLHWLEGAWHARWCELARLDIDTAPALLTIEAPVNSAAAVARSRMLHGAATSWPDGGELAVLRIWPSIRITLGVRLQAALSLGAQRTEIAILLPLLIAHARRSSETEQHARIGSLSRALRQYCGQNLGRDVARLFTRDLAWFVDPDLARDVVWALSRYFYSVGRDFRRGVGRDSGWDFDPDLGRHLSRSLGEDSRFLARAFDFGLRLPELMLTAQWLPTFVALELSSVLGRAASRATLAGGHLPTKMPLFALVQSACRASFHPNKAHLRAATSRACKKFNGDPLWPALARHVARMSTPDDRALLTDLARHPEKRESPLSWGLQYYVRGDLLLDDGSVVTLDELCSEAGIPTPPLLEDMPEEIVIPRDALDE